MQSTLSFRLRFRATWTFSYENIWGTWFLRVIRAVSFGTNSAEVCVLRREPEFQKVVANSAKLATCRCVMMCCLTTACRNNMLPRTMRRGPVRTKVSCDCVGKTVLRPRRPRRAWGAIFICSAELRTPANLPTTASGPLLCT